MCQIEWEQLHGTMKCRFAQLQGGDKTMWERKELKQRAKACLKLYYWPAVLVVLIASVLGGSSGFTMPGASGGNEAESVETITKLPEVDP